MCTYQVTFYKIVPDSSGHDFKCSQGSVTIRAAHSEERALKAAERRFERMKRINHWALLADLAELTASGSKATFRREPADHHIPGPPTLFRRPPHS